MIIKINEKYQILVDDLGNYELQFKKNKKKHHFSKNFKEGDSHYVTLGYFSSVENALKRYVKEHIKSKYQQEEKITIPQYIEELKQSWKQVENLING